MVWFRYFSVAALLLGAKKSMPDIDPQAILATEQNAALNGVAENLYVGLLLMSSI